MEHPQPDPAPFDKIAQDYDRSFSDTAVGWAQRQRVWYFLSRFFQENNIQNVLECNCGSGTDAIWLAGQGKQVLATDISSQMVEITADKAEKSGLSKHLQTAVVSMQELHTQERILQYAPFDLLFSDFGGLNCLSPEEIRQWGQHMKPLLMPGGWLALVVMSRFTCWETLYFLLKGKADEAFRRGSRTAVQARLDVDTFIPTWYFSPKELGDLLPGYTIKECRPIGFWLPPSYLDPFFLKRPKWLRLLEWLEKKSAARWLSPVADHYFLLLQKKQD